MEKENMPLPKGRKCHKIIIAVPFVYCIVVSGVLDVLMPILTYTIL